MMSVRLILAIAKLHNLDSKAINFVLAFLQADLEEDVWVYLPIGFQVDGHPEESSERRYLPKLNKHLYGLKQGSYNWYEKLKSLSLIEVSNLLTLIHVYTLETA